MKDKKYVFQIGRDDLAEIAAAVDPTPGPLVRIVKKRGSLMISIDENALKIAIAAFIKNGGPQQTTVEGICNTPLELK